MYLTSSWYLQSLEHSSLTQELSLMVWAHVCTFQVISFPFAMDQFVNLLSNDIKQTHHSPCNDHAKHTEDEWVNSGHSRILFPVKEDVDVRFGWPIGAPCHSVDDREDEKDDAEEQTMEEVEDAHWMSSDEQVNKDYGTIDAMSVEVHRMHIVTRYGKKVSDALTSNGHDTHLSLTFSYARAMCDLLHYYNGVMYRYFVSSHFSKRAPSKAKHHSNQSMTL